MSKQLTKTQQQLLADIKGVIARGRAVELFPDCLVGLDTRRHLLHALDAKGAIRLVPRDVSSYISARTYGPCLSVEIV